MHTNKKSYIYNLPISYSSPQVDCTLGNKILGKEYYINI